MLDLRRHVAGRSVFFLGIGRELTDAGTTLGGTGTTTVISAETQSLAQGSVPYTNEYARAGWEIAGRLTRLGGSLGFYRESYVEAPLQNRDRVTAEIHTYRNLGPRLSLHANASHSSDSYDNLVVDASELTAGAGVTWRAGRRFSVDTAYEHSYRNSDVSTSKYRENRIWVTLRWGDTSIRNVGLFGAL